MPLTNPDKPLCTRCEKRNGQVIYKGLCHRCYAEIRQVAKSATPFDGLAKDMAKAQTEDDWKRLYATLAPTIESVAKGELKASAAQAALLKEIMSRAFGRVTKSQEESKGPSGIVVLPTLDNGILTHMCPICLEEHAKHSA